MRIETPPVRPRFVGRFCGEAFETAAKELFSLIRPAPKHRGRVEGTHTLDKQDPRIDAVDLGRAIERCIRARPKGHAADHWRLSDLQSVDRSQQGVCLGILRIALDHLLQLSDSIVEQIFALLVRNVWQIDHAIGGVGDRVSQSRLISTLGCRELDQVCAYRPEILRRTV